jgi:hypothetical protein
MPALAARPGAPIFPSRYDRFANVKIGEILQFERRIPPKEGL